MDRGPILKLQPIAKGRKLLDAARNYPCAWCAKDDGTIVAAHCNELALGRGFGFKTQDFLVAYLCHDHVDGRAGGFSLELKRAMWNRAFVQTMTWLWRDGIIKVA